MPKRQDHAAIVRRDSRAIGRAGCAYYSLNERGIAHLSRKMLPLSVSRVALHVARRHRLHDHLKGIMVLTRARVVKAGHGGALFGGMDLIFRGPKSKGEALREPSA